MARRRGVRLERFDVRGFATMRDQLGPAFKPGEFLYAYNLLPEARDRPSPLVLRPGFKRLLSSSAPGSTAAPQLDTGGGTPKMRWADFCPFSANRRTVVISGDGIYSIHFGTATVTTELTSAQITGAGADIAAFAGACFFNNKLVVATGAGKPWTWDGTTGGGIALIANAASGDDLPFVYAAKLFFRRGFALVWSEEADETLGYTTAPYDNQWDLRQTNQHRIVDVAASEAGIFVMREAGVGRIQGQVDANFRTTATRDDIAPELPCLDPSSHLARARAVGRDGILFCDALGRPYIWRPSGLRPLWHQLPRRFWLGAGIESGSSVAPDAEPWGLGAFGGPGEWGADGFDFLTPTPLSLYYDGFLETHVVLYYSFGGTFFFLHFDAHSDRLVSVWVWRQNGVDQNAGATFIDPAVSLVGSGGDLLIVDGAGYCYRADYNHRQNSGLYWNDETFNGPGTPVHGMLAGAPVGYGQTDELHFERADALVSARTAHHLDFGWITSEQHKGSLAPGTQQFDESGLTNTPFQRRIEFGFEAIGRWLIPHFDLWADAGDANRPTLYGYDLWARRFPSQAGR